MRRLLATSLLLALLLTPFAYLRGDDEADEKPSPEAAKQKKVEELTKELERIRAELAKQGVPVPPVGAALPVVVPPPAGVAPPTGLPHDPKSIGEHQQKVKAQQEKIVALTKKHGPDSAEVRKAIDDMHKLMAAAGYHHVAAPQPPTTPPGAFPGALNRPLASGPGVEQYRAFLEVAGELQGPAESAEMGQKMVMAGLELQLKELAASIRASDDEEARQTMTDELKELVDMVIAVREKYRSRQIERLQKRLIELQDQGEHAESAEEVLKRLLAPPQEAAKEEAAE